MKILTSTHYTIRLVQLLAWLLACNISFSGCSGSNQSFITPETDNPTKKATTPEPDLFIETPERMVGAEGIKFTLMRTSKIPLQELSISLTSTNNATFQLIKTNGESGGTNAKLSEVTDYNNRYQEDMTLPIKIKLNQANEEKEATVTIVIQQANKVLIKKDIHWVKDGINMGLQTDVFKASDEDEMRLTLTNLGNKPIDLSEVIIDCKCTDFQMIFMLGNVSSQEANTSLDQVTRLAELGSGLSTKVRIRPCSKLRQNELAVGLKVSLLEKKDSTKPQVITSIPLVIHTHKLNQVQKQIYQLIGGHSEKLDSLENEPSFETDWLMTSKAKLEEGIDMYRQSLEQLAAIQKSDPVFTSLISNLVYDHTRQIKRWQTDINKIQLTQQGKPTEALTKRSNMLQEQLAKIPNILPNKLEIVQKATNLTDITTTLLADYNRELPIEQQSVWGLHEYAQCIAKEFDTIQKSLRQQGKTRDVDFITTTNQIGTIERQAQVILKEGFRTYKSTLSQPREHLFSQTSLKEQGTRNQLSNQLALQATTLATWAKYIKDNQNETSIEDNLYIVESYEKLAHQALTLSRAYYKDPDYQTGIHACADLATDIAREAIFLAQVHDAPDMQKAAVNACKSAIKICELLEKLPQTKKLPPSHQIRWRNANYHVWPSELADLSKILEQYEQK